MPTVVAEFLATAPSRGWNEVCRSIDERDTMRILLDREPWRLVLECEPSMWGAHLQLPEVHKQDILGFAANQLYQWTTGQAGPLQARLNGWSDLSDEGARAMGELQVRSVLEFIAAHIDEASAKVAEKGARKAAEELHALRQ